MQSRENAGHSWEISQVNELLHSMENFKGVMIGATNFVKSLDAAIMRRFTFKLEFDYLDDKGKALFFKRFFHTELSHEEEKRLFSIASLAPGDFRTVRQAFFYRRRKQDTSAILAALEQESAAKNNKIAHRIGFER